MSRTVSSPLPYRLRVDRLDDRINPAPAVALSSNTLFAFDTDFPGTVGTGVAVVGLGAGENLVAIDVRPQTGGLYGLTSDGAGSVRLYSISRQTGQATPLTTAPVRFDDGAGNPVNIQGTSFGMDFNPTVDRIRIVTDKGQNFRINPNTGLLIDGNNGGAAAVSGQNPDGNLTIVTGGASTAATGSGTAYTNSSSNAALTTQYTLDAATDKLFVQTSPNVGNLDFGVTVTGTDGKALDFTAANGFDILPSVTTDKANTPVTAGTATALLTVGGATAVYTIDLASGKAVARNTLGLPAANTAVQGLALLSTGNTPFIGLAGGSLIRFTSATTGSPVVLPVSGLTTGETLVGIDLRPQTGQLYGLGVNATADTATLYLIDPQGSVSGTPTATLTAVGTAGGIAYVDAAGKAVDLPAGTAGYGVDFNPAVDRVRVVTGTGLNFRVNPLTGAAVDGDLGGAAGSVTGTNTDANLNGGGTGSVATGTAYTNSFAPLTGAGKTTQYTLDSGTDKLFIQNPPNSGTLTNGVSITLGGAALNFTEVNGFDIPAGVTVTASNTAATGSGFAGLTVGGKAGLYRIDLATGAATLLGTSGDGTVPLTGLVAGDVVSAGTSAGLVGSLGFAAGSDTGAAAAAGIFRADKSTQTTVAAPGTGTTGARVASADFNGDGVVDIAVGSGPGVASTVTVFDGRDGSTKLFTVAPFETTFTGGVYVAAGDVNADGRADLVITPDQTGGPRVDIYSGAGFATGAKLASFFGIADATFRGGARAAVGDVNGDGTGDVVVAAGFGGGPRVAVFNGTTVGTATPTTLFNDFFAFESTLRNGVFIAVGDVDGDGRADIIAGGGPGGGPRVLVINGATLISSGGATQTPLANFFAGNDANRGGVRVTARNLDGDARADIVTGNGPGLTNTVTAYAGSALTPTAAPVLFSFDPFATGGTQGVYVG